MSSRTLAFSDWLYRLLLRFYPAEFQARYATEMAQVFRMVCQDAYAGSGAGGLVSLWLPMLGDWARAAILQWGSYLFKRKGEATPANLIKRKDEVAPQTPFQAALAVLPFLLFGLGSLLMRFNFFYPAPGSPFTWVRYFHPITLFNILLIAGIFASLVSGFPRWGYSYLGWTIIYLWWRVGSFPGDWFSNLSLPLFFAALLAALLVRRSIQPLRNMLAGLWQDWTVLSFAVYLFYSFVFMIYDENHNPYLYILMVASTLSLSLGAWGYFRAASPLGRVLSLIGGLLLAIIVSIIDSYTWDYTAYYHLPEGTNPNLRSLIIFFVILALLMLGNGLLAYWRSRRKMSAA